MNALYKNGVKNERVWRIINRCAIVGMGLTLLPVPFLFFYDNGILIGIAFFGAILFGSSFGIKIKFEKA